MIQQARGESLFVFMRWLSYPNLLEFEVIEMVSLKSEETLHDCLRRYFERISKGRAVGVAAEREAPEVDVVAGFPELRGPVENKNVPQ